MLSVLCVCGYVSSATDLDRRHGRGNLAHDGARAGTHEAVTILSALARSPPRCGPLASFVTMAALTSARPSSVRWKSAAMVASSTPRRERIRATRTPVPFGGQGVSGCACWGWATLSMVGLDEEEKRSALGRGG